MVTVAYALYLRQLKKLKNWASARCTRAAFNRNFNMAPKEVFQMSLIAVTTHFCIVDIPKVHQKPGLVENWGGGCYPNQRSKRRTDILLPSAEVMTVLTV